MLPSIVTKPLVKSRAALWSDERRQRARPHQYLHIAHIDVIFTMPLKTVRNSSSSRY